MRSGFFFFNVNGPIVVSQLQCAGTEENLNICPHVRNPRSECSDHGLVGVVCQTGTYYWGAEMGKEGERRGRERDERRGRGG